MNGVFLKVDKDLFSFGFNPTEILIIAQVMEYLRTTGKCFVTNKQFADMFGVSESTIKRELDKLESNGYIIRHTVVSKEGNGKERTIDLRDEAFEKKWLAN